VFSFAVVMWQTFHSRTTHQPYSELRSDSSIAAFVTAGRRLTEPRSMPSEVARLMQRCWAHDAELRPSFREVADVLAAFEAQYASGDEKLRTPLERQYRNNPTHSTAASQPLHPIGRYEAEF
jgi:hypothetical protein